MKELVGCEKCNYFVVIPATIYPQFNPAAGYCAHYSCFARDKIPNILTGQYGEHTIMDYKSKNKNCDCSDFEPYRSIWKEFTLWIKSKFNKGA